MTTIELKCESLEALHRLIPSHCIEGLLGYIESRIPVGDFLTAVLENNLMEACGRADDTNKYALPNYALFLYNYAPSACYGSKAKVTAWLERHDEQRFNVRSEGQDSTLMRKEMLSIYSDDPDVLEWVAQSRAGDERIFGEVLHRSAITRVA